MTNFRASQITHPITSPPAPRASECKSRSLAALTAPAILTLSLLATPALGRDIPSAKAEREGMSSARLEQVTSLGERYVADGRVPGMITMVARNGKIVHFEAQDNVA